MGTSATYATSATFFFQSDIQVSYSGTALLQPSATEKGAFTLLQAKPNGR